MAFKHRYADGWYKNAAGLYVQNEPISAALVAAASTGDVVSVATDGTLELTTPSGGSSGGGPITPDTVPDSPDPDDDEFDAGISIDTGFWTAVNTTNLSNAIVDGGLVLTITSAAVQLRGYVQPITTDTAWRYRCKVAIDGNAGNTTFSTGLLMRESATGKLLVLNVGYSAGDLIWAARWTNVSSFGATFTTVTPTPSPRYAPYYLEVEKSGSNYICRYSSTGRRFKTLTTQALTAAFTTAADEIGVQCYSDSGSNDAAGVFEWFRRVA